MGRAVGKRLDYVRHTHRREPRVYVETVLAAVRLAGVEVDAVGDTGQVHSMHAGLRAGPAVPGEEYLPWYAAKVRGLLRGRPTSSELAVKLRALRSIFPSVVAWASATRTDVGGLSVAEAGRRSIQWHEELQQAPARRLGPEDQGEVVHVWRGGRRAGWTVQSLGVRHLAAEGQAMGHCIGGPLYRRGIEAGTLRVLSLRDRAGQPHATMSLRYFEWNTVSGRRGNPAHLPDVDRLQAWKVDEVQGRGNLWLRADYRELLSQFLDHAGVVERVDQRGILALNRLDRIEVPDELDEDGVTVWADPLTVSVVTWVAPGVPGHGWRGPDGFVRVDSWAQWDEEDRLEWVVEHRKALVQRLIRDPRMRPYLEEADRVYLPFKKTATVDLPDLIHYEDLCEVTQVDLNDHVLELVELHLAGALDWSDEFVLEATDSVVQGRPSRAMGVRASDRIRGWQEQSRALIKATEAEVAAGVAPWILELADTVFERIAETRRS